MAAFADALCGGEYLDDYGYAQIAKLANDARVVHANGYRTGFVKLVKLAAGLATPGQIERDSAAR